MYQILYEASFPRRCAFYGALFIGLNAISALWPSTSLAGSAVNHDLTAYSYTQSDINTLICNLGYEGNGRGGIARNGAGDAVYVYGSDHSGAKLVVLTAQGSVSAVSLPVKRTTWMDDDCEVKAWWVANEQDEVHFWDGSIRVIKPTMRFSADPGCLYFCVEEDGHAEIGSFMSPGTILATVSLVTTRLFCNDHKLYAIGDVYDSQDRLYRKAPTLSYHVFRREETKLVMEKEVAISRGRYYVEDMDPYAGKIILQKGYEEPLNVFNSFYYYNCETKDLQRLGSSFSSRSVVFLRDNILAKFGARGKQLLKPE